MQLHSNRQWFKDGTTRLPELARAFQCHVPRAHAGHHHGRVAHLADLQRQDQQQYQPYMLKQARLMVSPTLSLPEAACQQLLPQRRMQKINSTASNNNRNSVQTQAAFKSVQAVLALEVDGRMLQRQQLVELRFYTGRRSVRVHNHNSFDVMENRLLTGWKRDPDGRIVAVLKSLPGTAESASTADSSMQQVSSRNSPAPSHQQLDIPAITHLPQSIHHNPCQSSLQTHTNNFVQHLASTAAALSAAGAAHAAALLGKACTPHAERKCSFVPRRIRPVMNEVYAPFGLWRDLLGGGDKQFPSEGIPLRIMITGAVHLTEQPALLIRRCTPYGYFLLRGLRSLTLRRLKGKLMVRWSLLVNGVIEMEVADSMPPAGSLRPAAISGALPLPSSAGSSSAGNTNIGGGIAPQPTAQPIPARVTVSATAAQDVRT